MTNVVVLNGTQLECDGEDLRPDGSCPKCERVNLRIQSALAEAIPSPADVEKLACEIVHRHVPIGVQLTHGINGLERDIAAALSSRPVVASSCAWKFDPDGYWQTQCGDQFCISDGTPAENEMKFCHHCGGKLTVEGDRAVVAPVETEKWLQAIEDAAHRLLMPMGAETTSTGLAMIANDIARYIDAIRATVQEK